MEFFDVVKAIFSKTEWQKVSNEEKYKYAFVLNRILSVKYPVEMNMCQPIGLGKRNTCIMLDTWNIILANRFTSAPKWIYTKSGKKDAVESPLKGIDKDVIEGYMNYHQVSEKDIIFLSKIWGKELRTELLAFKKKLV